MSRHPFALDYQDLPETLPLFPLEGVLLLPGEKLPLNIFEPRYLAMVLDSLSQSRMIGMIQPSRQDMTSLEEGLHDQEPALYTMGCAGRIVSFTETDDGRVLVTLAGIIRFSIQEEVSPLRGYRRVRPAYGAFQDDMRLPPAVAPLENRSQFLACLKDYFALMNMQANWESLEEVPDDRLINSLAMICPFAPSEKQGLLESKTVAERASLMIALLTMAVRGGTLAKGSYHDGDPPIHN